MSAGLDNTFGCLFIASVLTMGLWGMGSVQVYYYYDRYTNDQWWLKLQVFAVWALDTAHQALILHSTYIYLVTEYANFAYLAHFESTIRDSIILTAFICALVQSFFVMRIYRLSKKNIPLTGVSLALVIAQFTSTVVYYAKAYHFTQFAELETIFDVTRTINVITMCSDVFIAGVLVYLLQNSRTGFKRSETMINRLVAFAVNTGLITSINAVISLVTGIALPTTFVYILFYLMLSRLYMNSMLATLNSRLNLSGNLTDGSSGPVMNSISMNNISVNNNRPGGAKMHKDFPGTHVNIKVDTETILDNGGRELSAYSSDPDLEAAYTHKVEAI
ncbi:hypothetical protein M0805_006766 [Coniferiporia weirii]|nr:hypothetical protein M0805_006766 [Coniferiporia weirii]